MIFLLLFCELLLSCCTKQDHWNVSHIKTGQSEFDSSKLTYLASDRINGIQLEFLRTKHALHLYAFVHSQPIPAYRGNPKQAKVIIRIEAQEFPFIAIRHAGGHRLLIPEETQDLITQSLHDAKSITLELQGYIETIESAGFSQHFEKLYSSMPFSTSLLKSRPL